VIQDIKEFRPELDAKGFGNLGHVSILEDRKVYSRETRTIKAVAPRIPEQVGAVNGTAGSRLCRSGNTLHCEANDTGAVGSAKQPTLR
jgi:hypothetical protein